MSRGKSALSQAEMSNQLINPEEITVTRALSRYEARIALQAKLCVRVAICRGACIANAVDF